MNSNMRISEEEYELIKKRQLKNKRQKILKGKGVQVKGSKQDRMTAEEYRKLMKLEEPEPKKKMGNKIVEEDGIRFDSKLEAKYYEQLKLLEIAGEVTKIKLQPRFLLQEGFNKNGKRYQPIHYIADFEVTYKDGTVEVIDVKGFETNVFKIKEKLFEYKYPDLKLKKVKKDEIGIS